MVAEKTKMDVLAQISTLTGIIEDQFPELQKYLDESRSTLPHNDTESGKMNEADLINYRDTLRSLIKSYKQK